MLKPEQLLAVARWVSDPKYSAWEICKPPYRSDHGVWQSGGGDHWRRFNPLADTTEGKAQLMDVWVKLLTCDKIYASWGGYFVTTQLVPSPTLSDPDYQTFNCVSKDGSRRDAAAILEAASYAIERGMVK